MMSLAEKIFECFKAKDTFTLQEAYGENQDKPKETVRARIYDNLGIRFERIAKGVYKTIDGEQACILLEGD
ncbi:MAG: site-specific DNA-methyltransferase, partial [Lachnospiraceae bacterium]|nr:site-specific DNA-methyltransferase [Lachnospiraceae bacterium]